MAEVIGIVAAAVQLGDVGAKIAIALSRLCSDLQHAPRKIKAANRQVKQLLDLIDMLKSDDLSSGGLVPPPHIDKAISLLTESIDQAKSLENLLVQLLPGPSDSRIKKGWRTIVTLKKEEEILEKCRHLEALKNSLNVWYNHENMLLLKQHISTTAIIGTSVQTLNRHVLPLRSEITSVGDRVQATDIFLRDTGTRIEAGIKSIDNQSVHISSELALVRDGINAVNTTAQQESQAIQTVLGAMGNDLSLILQHMTTHRQHSIQQQQEDHDLMVSYITSKPSFASEIAARHSSYETLLAKRRARLNRRPQPQFSESCTCTMRRSIWNIYRPSWHIFSSNYEEHQSDCPRYRQSRRSRTVGMRVILPRLLAKSIQVAFTATSGAGGFALSPYFALTCVVDRSKSPAFVMFDDAWTELCNHFGLAKPWPDSTQRYLACLDISRFPEGSSSKGKKVLEDIYNGLALQLNAGFASALDQDKSGTTLLHEVIHVALLFDRFQGDLSEVFAHLIRLLVDHGADINAQTPGIPDVMNKILTVERNLFWDPRGWCAGSPKIDQTLTQYGAEWMDIGHMPVGVPWHVRLFIRNPDLAIDYGCSQLCLSVCQRSQTELKRLIACGHEVNGLTQGYTPLCFAIGWPPGMKTLLDAGADASTAIHCAVAYSDEAAVTMLLEHGAKLLLTKEDLELLDGLSVEEDLSVLHYALEMRSSDNVIAQLARAAAAKRRQLADLARRHLSHEKLEALGTNVAENRDTVLDAGAELVAIALREEGVHVPSQIWPGNQTTVYHDDDMTVQAAAELYACGFHDVDTVDTDGWSPLLIACARPQWDLISWYLDKGASAVEFGLSGYQNGLQVVAQALGPRRDLSELRDQENRDNSVLARLGSLCSQILADDCTCYCSTYGCIPITMLIRRRYPWCGKEKTHIVEFVGAWLRACNVPPSIEEVCYAEACRLTIFERLGMVHTCCSLGYRLDPTVCYSVIYRKMGKSAEEVKELQEEDAVSKGILDMYMKLYLELRKEHAGPISEFWKAWLEAISERLPETEFEWSDELWKWVEIHSEPEASSVDTGFGPDEEAIRSRIRCLLHYNSAEDPASILSDSKWILSDAGTPSIISEPQASQTG